jgi:hypothetical protein
MPTGKMRRLASFLFLFSDAAAWGFEKVFGSGAAKIRTAPKERQGFRSANFR